MSSNEALALVLAFLSGGSFEHDRAHRNAPVLAVIGLIVAVLALVS